MMKLNERQRALLAAVIERYVQTAEPVGSAAMAADAGFVARVGSVSSATIRNELAELENLGLLAHPHTSAGRVPTDAGYRLYVNEMLRPRAIKPQERAQIHSQISSPASSVEDVLRDACVALAKLTGYPAVATLPQAGRDTVRQVQLNSLPPRRLVLALVTQTGRIEHRVFEVGADLPDERLATVVNFLNQKLSGRALSALRVLNFREISEGLHGAETLSLASRAFDFVKQSAEELGDERIVVQGLITLLDEPEFSDIRDARQAMRLFENAGAMNDLLQTPLEMYRPENAYAVVIGHELNAIDNPVAQRFSVVGVAYGLGDDVLGTVAVMGPTRMKYADAVSLAPVLAQRLKDSLESLE
jgi:heat-inducible transcriptional repressor